MAKLVVILNGAMVGNHFIDKGRITIGRRSGNDIHLDDPGVSKEHAVIQTVGNDHIFEDLGSTNGSTLNGSRITKHILQNGDVIELGAYQIKYANIKANPEMDYDRTMMIRTVDREIGAVPQSAGREAGANFGVDCAVVAPGGFSVGRGERYQGRVCRPENRVGTAA